jgi:Yip1-like protein
LSSVTPSVPAPEPEPSAAGRVVGAIFSPTATFASIARRPTWLAPLLLWTALSLGVTAVLMPKIDYEQVIRKAMEKRGQTIPEDRMASIIEQQKKIGGIFGWVGGGLAPTVISLLTAVVIWGSFKAFGWDTTFKQSYGATTHAFLPGCLKAVLLAVLVWRQETVDPQAIGDLLRSNLGFLVPSSESKPLHSLLSSFDAFSLWSLWLFVIGFAAAAKIKKGAAAGVIVTLWGVVVAAGVAWNVIF